MDRFDEIVDHETRLQAAAERIIEVVLSHHSPVDYAGIEVCSGCSDLSDPTVVPVAHPCDSARTMQQMKEEGPR